MIDGPGYGTGYPRPEDAFFSDKNVERYTEMAEKQSLHILHYKPRDLHILD